MKKTIIALAIVLMVFCAAPLFAADMETPPVSTVSVPVSELMPFRVWVFPGTVDGIQVSGHYEYFDMYMDTGKTKEVLEGPTQEPALKAVPITTGTAPAL